ncbi:MAG: hypothetical protein GY855_02625 [candidate division Zixibacteria bacterium]|nr:hypothetical protein [candidate division Zixibacteria bacterium]
MKSIEILMNEHVLIRECLNLLDKACDKIVKNDYPPKEFFEIAFNFSREFSDKFHHYKEEYVMFGYLAQKKEGDIDAQIEAHRSQHENCRNLISNMSDSLNGYSNELNESTRSLHRNLSDYVQTLRKHIRSENDVFFPMVLKVLSESDDKYLIEEFEKYEQKTDSNTWEKNQDIIKKMTEML